MVTLSSGLIIKDLEEEIINFSLVRFVGVPRYHLSSIFLPNQTFSCAAATPASVLMEIPQLPELPEGVQDIRKTSR